MKLQWLFAGTVRRQLAVSLIFFVIAAVSAIGIASIQIARQVIRNYKVRFGGKISFFPETLL